MGFTRVTVAPPDPSGEESVEPAISVINFEPNATVNTLVRTALVGFEVKALTLCF